MYCVRSEGDGLSSCREMAGTKRKLDEWDDSNLFAEDEPPSPRLFLRLFYHASAGDGPHSLLTFRVSRSLLRCRAASLWTVDCAARRALSLTLRLANCASLSSALSKARFLRSRSLLRLSLASLLCCASMIHVHVEIEVKG